MTSPLRGELGIDDSVADSFVAHLRALHESLPSEEAQLLETTLESAMGPWARTARRPVEEILTPEEIEILRLAGANLPES